MQNIKIIFCLLSFWIFRTYATCQTFTLHASYQDGNENYILDWNYSKFYNDYANGVLKSIRICEDYKMQDPCLKQELLEKLSSPIYKRTLVLTYVQSKLIKIGLLFSNIENTETSMAYLDYLPEKLSYYFVAVPLMKGSCLTTSAQLLQTFAFRHQILSDKPQTASSYQKNLFEQPAKKVEFLLRNEPWLADTHDYKKHDKSFLPYLTKFIWKNIEKDKIIVYKADSFQVKFPKDKFSSEINKIQTKNIENSSLNKFPNYDSLALSSSLEMVCLIRGGTTIQFEPYYLILKWTNLNDVVPLRNVCAVKYADVEKLGFAYKGRNLKSLLSDKNQIMYPIKINNYLIDSEPHAIICRKALLDNQWNKLSENE